MSKFTQGMWDYVHRKDDFMITAYHQSVTSATEISFVVGFSNTEADARLITAAPLMYEMLKLYAEDSYQGMGLNLKEKTQKLLARINGEAEVSNE